MYSVTAYYLAKSTADLPFQIIYPCIVTTIIYWMVGLKEEAGAFFICLGITILVANIAQSLGLLVSVGTDLPYVRSLALAALQPHH
jgi:hypothetical protein